MMHNSKTNNKNDFKHQFAHACTGCPFFDAFSGYLKIQILEQYFFEKQTMMQQNFDPLLFRVTV